LALLRGHDDALLAVLFKLDLDDRIADIEHLPSAVNSVDHLQVDLPIFQVLAELQVEITAFLDLLKRYPGTLQLLQVILHGRCFGRLVVRPAVCDCQEEDKPEEQTEAVHGFAPCVTRTRTPRQSSTAPACPSWS